MSAGGYAVRWVDAGGLRRSSWSRLADAILDADRIKDIDPEPELYQVHPDGREERLPSYEEALTALACVRDEARRALDYRRTPGGQTVGSSPPLWTCPPSALKELLRLTDGAPAADPLAALEAAERRLLEAGGWTLAEPDVYGGERWTHPTWKGGNEARTVALTIERRRLAAKGGA